MQTSEASAGSARSVLVVGPSWVGDTVLAQSLLRTLKEASPQTVIDMLAPRWSLPVIERMPEVREAIEMPLDHGEFRWSVRWRLGRGLRGRHYDQAIVLPRSFKSALVPFHARIPHRTGYRGEMRFGLLNDIRPMGPTVLDETVQRFVALGWPAGAPQPPPVPQPQLRVDHDNQQRLMAELGLETDPPVIGMMPGAEYGPAKCWPLEYFAELAARLVAARQQVWIFGSAKERAAGEQIAAAGGSAIHNLCGRTQLEDVVDLLALAHKTVTNDSGLMHIAAAVGTHVVAIYGSSTPVYTPPLTQHQTVHYLGIECSPCFERTCRFGHYRCLKEIAVTTVLDSVTG